MPQDSSLICSVVTEQTTAACRAAIAEAGTVADIIEVRLDYLRDFDFTNPDNLRPLLKEKPRPLIITCRSIAEGGQQHVEDKPRLRLLVEGARQMADYCDIEAASYREAALLSPDLSRLIISHHNFTETPGDLEGVYERLINLPAAVHKIVTRANRVTDSLGVLRLLDRARLEERSLIALAMEAPGLITRVLGPSRGCFLTYGSLGPGRESAPGQITCDELRNVYRVNELSRGTKITGIIGKPVSHSASPAMHNAAFKALGLDFVYLPIEVDDVGEFFTRFVRLGSRETDWDLRGFSVTIPHKTAVVPWLDNVDATARRIGAVNTVVIEEGETIGHNTDAAGALDPLERVCSIEGQSCAVIGAGGAARAVVYGLVKRAARVTLFARDTGKARQLGEEFDIGIAPLDAFESSDAAIVINTTPVGMHGHSEGATPVGRTALRGRRIVYDLVYNPLDTAFLRDARAEGCETISGIEMLVAQAASQFRLWTGEAPPIDVMREAALSKLPNPDVSPETLSG
jgi:3-dehydroquinate dehydratase/shikimate dehydrogenase